MLLRKIFLSQFRNFTKAEFNFNPHLTIIIGENARGKTSLLEAVYFSIFGIGFRESKEEELVKWNEDQSLVETNLEGDEKLLFQIMLRRMGEKIEKKYYINKTLKTHFQYKQNQTTAVLFAPEHIDVVTGSPDKRRDYFNRLISAFDPDYYKKLRNFENALRKRNKVLEFYKDEFSLDEEIAFWNKYILEHASYLTQKRQEYVDYLNQNQKIDHRRFEITYLKNEFNQERIDYYYELEKRMRKTAMGPQKDDFEITLHDEGVSKNVAHFGSRSEQRLAVFWLKLNEIKFFETVLKKKPILLLDDIFSELDVKNKKLVLDLIVNYQTILTTTENELIELSTEDKEIIRL